MRRIHNLSFIEKRSRTPPAEAASAPSGRRGPQREAESQRAIEQLEQDAVTIGTQREQLSSIGIARDQLERPIQPMVSFREQLQEDTETHEIERSAILLYVAAGGFADDFLDSTRTGDQRLNCRPLEDVYG